MVDILETNVDINTTFGKFVKKYKIDLVFCTIVGEVSTGNPDPIKSEVVDTRILEIWTDKSCTTPFHYFGETDEYIPENYWSAAQLALVNAFLFDRQDLEVQ